jgi:hypothetical protein
LLREALELTTRKIDDKLALLFRPGDLTGNTAMASARRNDLRNRRL